MKVHRVALIRNAKSYDFGGGERFPVFVAKVLQKNNIDPVIVSRHTSTLDFAQKHTVSTVKGWWWSCQDWSSWRVVLTPFYIIWQIILTFYYYVMFLKLQPQVVHIQSKDDFIAGTFAARFAGAMPVWTDHADLKHVWLNLGVWYKNPIGKMVYAAAHYTSTITVVSKSEEQAVTSHLSDESPIRKKIAVVYNGCPDVFNDYSRSADNHKGITYIVASRLVTDKGIGEAITAFLKLNSSYPDTRLVIAGDGPEREKFEKQASTNTAISFIGHQSDPYNIINSADIFLQPTYHEGFSVVLVEASMLQKPIIATSVGGNVEIIKDNKTGLLIPSKDAAALYDAMEKLYLDKSLRNSLGDAARKQYESNFVFDDIVLNHFLPFYNGSTHDKD